MKILRRPMDGATREARRDGRARPTPDIPDGPPDKLPDDPEAVKRRLLETLVDSAAGTQEDLAADLQISYATLHAWKTGRREVPADALEKMARLALRRSRILLEAGSRLLRLADLEEPPRGEPVSDGVRLAAAETRARARAMREQARETSDRLRRQMTRESDSSG